MCIQLTAEEIRMVSRIRGYDISRVYNKKGKLVFYGDLEDCLWYCNTHPKAVLTIDIVPPEDKTN